MASTVFFIAMVFMFITTVSCDQQCETCPSGCQCTPGELDCTNLNLTSVFGCGRTPIKRVDFSANNINVINWSELPILSDTILCSTVLTRNNITRSEGVLTTETCRYIYVYMTHNPMERLATDFLVLDATVARSVSFLFVFLYGNQVREISSGWINPTENITLSSSVTVDLTNNMVSYIETGAFSFHVGGTLTLDLENNRIISLLDINVPGLFNAVSQHLDLHLEDNLIEGLEQEVDLALSQSGQSHNWLTLYMKDNPLICDCTQRWLAYDNSSLRAAILHTFVMDERPKCVSPPRMRGISIASASPDELICPPRLDPEAVLSIEATLGQTFAIHCPVIGADPPVPRYEWIFRESTTSARPDWDLYQETETDEIVIRHVRSNGTYQCRPVFTCSELAISINVTVKLI